ncbi:hypothetical protein [Halogeometricum limi]|uniref:Uncharacterized protein n=1 Tax=Halogeometricum limi TaxID=555875 RepID=A0A1I6IBW6_9EURY|nr:hypothetical protein [Halogeometricum limi]SFR64188.1 hypothetical protein SAMN04488124_3011 [Halogeometricum limi]
MGRSSQFERQLQLWSVRGVNVPTALVTVAMTGLLVFAATRDPSVTAMDGVFIVATIALYVVGTVDRFRTCGSFRTAGIALVGSCGGYLLLTAARDADIVVGGYLLFALLILVSQRAGLIE